MMIDFIYLHVCKNVCLWYAYGLWNKCQSNTQLAYEPANWLKIIETCMYVMFSNFCSNNLTRKNIHNNVGSLIRYKPLSCETTNYKSRHTSRERTPCEMASSNNSITALYSATLFEEGRKHMPPEDNTWPIGV